LVDSQESVSWIPGLLKALLDVPASSQPYEYLEICLLEAASRNKTAESIKEDKNKKDIDPPRSKSAENSETVQPKQTKPVKTPSPSAFSLDVWPEVVVLIKKQAASLYTALKLASPSYEEGILMLAFQFPLHQKKVNQSKYKETIAQVIENLTGASVKIECVVNKDVFEAKSEATVISKPAEPEDEGKFTHQLQSISNIFGTAEVLES
jgi:hypothetical protein